MRLVTILLSSFLGLPLAQNASAAEVESSLALFDSNIEAGGEFEPGTLALKVEVSMGLAEIKAVARNHGCRWDHQWGKAPYHTVYCDPSTSMRKAIIAFSAAKGVRWVEAGFYDDGEETTPNDLFEELQWYHSNIGQPIDMVAGTPGVDLGSLDAWEVTTGSPSIVIAIVDIGIFTGHQDLSSQVWTNSGEVCGNGRDDDNNGYIDDCNGWDFGGNDPDASPLTLPEMRTDGSNCLRWHATYIAGLAAAQGNNGQGLVGGAWDVSLMNLKRHRDSSCRGNSARSAEAVLYAIANGADVLGFSFNSTTRSLALEDALSDADAAGIIAIMSAGNGGRSINSSTRYPNNYPMTNKIITAASNNRDQLDPSSNYGSSKVDMAMPGTYVVSTAIESAQAYGVGSGTSMAVGFGLAAVALAKTAFPSASANQVVQAMLAGGRAVPGMDCSNSSRCVRTGRRLDYVGMLKQLNPLSPANLNIGPITMREFGSNNGAANPGERIAPQFTVQNAGPGGGAGLRGSLRVISGSGLTAQTPSRVFGTAAPGQSITPTQYIPTLEVSRTCSTDFDAQVELTVVDVLGNSAVATWAVPVRCVGQVPPPDAGVVADSGPTNQPDSGTVDAGASVDATTPLPRDSGVHPLPRDSGVHPDASVTNEPPVFAERSGCNAGLGVDGAALWILGLMGLFVFRSRPRA